MWYDGVWKHDHHSSKQQINYILIVNFLNLCIWLAVKKKGFQKYILSQKTINTKNER